MQKLSERFHFAKCFCKMYCHLCKNRPAYTCFGENIQSNTYFAFFLYFRKCHKNVKPNFFWFSPNLDQQAATINELFSEVEKNANNI